MEITTADVEPDGQTRYTISADEIEMRYLLAGLGALNANVAAAFSVPTVGADAEDDVLDVAEEIVLALGFAGAVP